ncbi:MAG: WG repeat-containing protein [Coprobacter sp.]|nr:WG repeat-containing protein [Coprobacter sp.]
MKNKLYLLTFTCSLICITCCTQSNPKDIKLLRVQENGLYGFIDTLGHIVIEPQYKYIGDFSSDGYALVISKAIIENDSLCFTYGFIDKENKLIVDTINNLKISSSNLSLFWRYNEPDVFAKKFNSNSLEFRYSYLEQICISQGVYQYADNKNLLGYKDLDGNIVIPAKYQYAGPFVNGVAIVSEGITYDLRKSYSDNLNIFSLINLTGEYVKEKAWAHIQEFSKEGLTWCNEYNEGSVIWTQIDREGKIKIGPIDSQVGSMIYNGYPNNNGLYIYDFPEFFGIHLGYSFINENGKYATDKNGDNAITVGGGDGELFNDVTHFSEGFAGVKVFLEDDTRWTFMDPNFEIVTTELYDSVKPFTENLAVVQHSGYWGVIDKNFNLVIPYKFSKITKFHDGFAYAKIGCSKYDREGWINRKGEFIWETNRIHPQL